MNQRGFRERDFAAYPEPGVLRIAHIGDSVTYGAGIHEHERVTNQLEALLNRQGANRVEVLNFGKPGADYEELADQAQVAIRSSRPHYLVYQWLINDLDDPADRRPDPKQPGWIFHEQLSGSSVLYLLLARAASDLQVRLGLVRIQDYYARFLDPRDPIAHRAELRLRRIIDLARAADIPIVIYFWPELSYGIGHSPNEPVIEHVLASCRAEGLQCIDLRPALAREQDRRRLIVNRFDVHPSGYANSIAADVLFHRLGPGWIAKAEKLRAATEMALPTRGSSPGGAIMGRRS